MEINFKTANDEDLVEMIKYFKNCRLHLSGFSAGARFMWQKYYGVRFAYVADCLVLAGKQRNSYYFNYPISLIGSEDEELAALGGLEDFCRERGARFCLANVPKERLPLLTDRYGFDLRVTNERKWRDYLYEAENFKSYAGKKYAGQRNHVNKFKKLYQGYEFCELSPEDEGEVIEFLNEFSSRQLAKDSKIAKEELEGVYALVPNIRRFGLFAGALRVGGKIIGLSIGEQCGDMLVIHVEKALTVYEGAYPLLAQEFARRYAMGDIKYINREDDSGDKGLRKSKLQYNPVRLVDKFMLFPRRLIDCVSRLPVLRGERLTVKAIEERDKDELFRLEYDGERNRFWGYDWREHFKGEPTPETFLNGWRRDFKGKCEMPMGVYLGDRFLGEVVLHNFGYRCDCEAGVRLLPEYEGQGYAREAIMLACDYALYDLDAEVVYAKCFKQNARSRNTLLSANFVFASEDETYFYFKRTART